MCKCRYLLSTDNADDPDMNTCKVVESAQNEQAIAKFRTSSSERGPHSIPRDQQIAKECHRIYSVKAGRILIVDSQLKAQAIFYAEGDPEITTLCEQPIRIHGSYGTNRYVTLDLSFTYKSSAEVIYAIKPIARLVEHKDGRYLPAKWELIEAWASANGHDIRVMTSDWLAGYKVQISNWKFLLGFVRHFRMNRDPDLEAEVLGQITNNPKISIAALLEQLRMRDELLVTSCVASLLHEGHLTASLNRQSFTRFSGIVCNEN